MDNKRILKNFRQKKAKQAKAPNKYSGKKNQRAIRLLSTMLGKGSQWNNLYKVCDSQIRYPAKLSLVIWIIIMHFPITKEK